MVKTYALKDYFNTQQFHMLWLFNFSEIDFTEKLRRRKSFEFSHCVLDWRDESHNFAIYIFSKYLIGAGQS